MFSSLAHYAVMMMFIMLMVKMSMLLVMMMSLMIVTVVPPSPSKLIMRPKERAVFREGSSLHCDGSLRNFLPKPNSSFVFHQHQINIVSPMIWKTAQIKVRSLRITLNFIFHFTISLVAIFFPNVRPNHLDPIIVTSVALSPWTPAEARWICSSPSGPCCRRWWTRMLSRLMSRLVSRLFSTLFSQRVECF